MSNYTSTADISGGGYHGGGMGGYGGGWLVGALIIFFLLFRGDGFGGFGGHRGGHGGEHGHTRNGGYDELNYEQDYKWITAQNEHDKTQTANSNKILEKMAAEQVQALRDKITERDMIIVEQRNEAVMGRYFGALNGRLDRLECGLPKARPQYASTVTPCLGELPRCGEPRRGGCDFD